LRVDGSFVGELRNALGKNLMKGNKAMIQKKKKRKLVLKERR